MEEGKRTFLAGLSVLAIAVHPVGELHKESAFM